MNYGNDVQAGFKIVDIPCSYTTIYCVSRTTNASSNSSEGIQIRASYVETYNTSQIKFYTAGVSKYMFILIGY